MEIHAITDPNAAPVLPIPDRYPARKVIPAGAAEDSSGQGNAMAPGSDRSQTGLIARALVEGSAPSADGADGAGGPPPERRLKPWGITMLPDDSRDPAHPDAAAEIDSVAPVGRGETREV